MLSGKGYNNGPNLMLRPEPGLTTVVETRNAATVAVIADHTAYCVYGLAADRNSRRQHEYLIYLQF